MRTILLTRGIPASSKSTWIKENKLEPYTLSADNIRLLMQSPVTNIDGKLVITQKNDSKVWALLFNLLEQRMERGEFIVVDGTHYRAELLHKYYNLIDKYRYRAYVVDFTDVPLSECIKRNKEREAYKFVPEEVLRKMHAVFEAEKNSEKCKEVSNKFTIIKPDEVRNMLKKEYLIKDYTDLYEKVIVFGDIHGCYEPLKNYFELNPFNEKYLYIFTGDYVDRGIQNKEVLEFLIKIKDSKNVILLEGNHECIHKDTDILTDKGWVNIAELVNSHNEMNCKPYSYNIGKDLIEVDTIKAFHKKHQDTMVCIETNNTKQVVSKNHDVLLGKEKVLAKDILAFNSGKIDSIQHFIKPTSRCNHEAIDFSDDMLSLITWIVCDGTLVDAHKNKPEYAPKIRVQFKLSRLDKIQCLENLLNKMNIKYTKKEATKDKNNVLQPYLIRIYGDTARKLYDIFGGVKVFPESFRNLNDYQLDVVLNSILSTDGSKQMKRIFWYTNNQKNIDIIQEACVKNGYAFSVRSENKSGFKKSSHSYVCCITKNWDFVKNKNRVSEIPYDDYSYCITTENGTLITRIDGKVAITGNCHLRKYSEKNADLDSITSNEFKLNTIPQIESISKKDLRQLCRKLSQMEFFYFGVNRYVVCHGGIPCEPSILTPTVELIKGVGKYEDDELIGKNFRKNSCKDCILVHAHRNIFNRPIKVSDNHYNLCDSPETGGCVRIIEIEKNGEIKEILQQNTVYNVKAERPVSTLDSLNINTKNDTLKQMNESKLIQKKVLDNGIVSYNFTRKCFYDKIWNDLTCKARGLFVDSETDKVIARGYSKFHNIDELESTTLSSLYKTFEFPVTAYLKENGFLGLVSYNPKADDLFIASKSTNKGDYADMVREEINKLGKDKYNLLLKTCKDLNVTFTFEVINKDKDPHIIEYKENHLVLLDGILNELDSFRKIPYTMLNKFAQDLGVKCKELCTQFNTWEEFKSWYHEIDKNNKIQIEGFVLEDQNGFMVKYKTAFYKFWKSMRGLKDKMQASKDIRPSFSNETEIRVYNYMRTLTPEELKSKSIIDIRKEYLDKQDV